MKDLLKKYHDDSFGWAMHCCNRNQEQAEEVLQQAYLKVLEGKARFHEKGSFKNWFFVVIRNTARDIQRKSKPLFQLEQAPQSVSSIQSEIIAHEEVDLILSALKQLSERQQSVLHLVFYQDLTIEEAAELLNISLGSARTHYQRGKERLKKILENRKQELY